MLYFPNTKNYFYQISYFYYYYYIYEKYIIRFLTHYKIFKNEKMNEETTSRNELFGKEIFLIVKNHEVIMTDRYISI